MSIEANLKAISINREIIGQVKAYQDVQDMINAGWDVDDIYWSIQIKCENIMKEWEQKNGSDGNNNGE